MKFVKILSVIFVILFIPLSLMAGEKDIIKDWIKEDMEELVTDRSEELAIQREKAMLEGSKYRIQQLYKIAKELIKLEKYDEAREKYVKILELDPRESKAQEYIAKLDRIKELSEANEMKKALSQEEKEKRDNYNKFSREGAELYRNKRYKEAREKWEEALRYVPDNESLKEWIKRTQIREVEEAKKDIVFEKNLEEELALTAIDEAYFKFKRKAKEKVEKPEEEKIAREEERKRKIEEMLETTEISLDLKNVDLERIVTEISTRAKLTIFVDWTAISEATGISAGSAAAAGATEGEGEAGGETAPPVEAGQIKTMNLTLIVPTPIPLKSVFDYLMKITRLKYRIEEHAVLISTSQALEKEEMVTKIYKLKYGMTKLRPVTLKPLGKEAD